MECRSRQDESDPRQRSFRSRPTTTSSSRSCRAGLTTDDAIIAAYIALVDKICPCVLLLHSQAGGFGFKVAEARPDKIKAIVAVEPAIAGDKRQGRRAEEHADAGGLRRLHAARHPRWPKMRKIDIDYADAIARRGRQRRRGQLPEVGIKGNSHMLMMDKNNGQVADLIQKWLADKGLVE